MYLFIVMACLSIIPPADISAEKVHTSPTVHPSAIPTASNTCMQSQKSCGASGCFDPSTHQCCPSGTNVCEVAQTCVTISVDNNLTNGCCPSDTSICGDQCIDTRSTKCCPIRGTSKYGTCPAGSDCCGDKCCDAGDVCVRMASTDRNAGQVEV